MLHLHRSARADRLVDALAEVLRMPPADPFAREVVAVPAKGVERWVTQRLSHVLGARAGAADGVCANVRFPSPAALVREAVTAAAATVGSGPVDADPWEQGRLLWTLFEVVHACADESWCATLARHLGLERGGLERDGLDSAVDRDSRRGRRFTTVHHLSRLFTSYGQHRPGMLRDWAAGDDTDGAGGRLPADLLWQAELWRRLRAALATPSPAERLPGVCAALRDGAALDLPERLSLFGPTRLATDALEVLAALAARREVHLWLPHPSPVLWARIAAAVPEPSDRRRRNDATSAVVRHPLLASLSRDARELQQQLASCGGAATDRAVAVDDRPATLLGALQRALQDDAVPVDRPLLSDGDSSVQVHACHGPARQVEVLREVLVGLLADDPTLEPRDVLVMCPDIEDYAPLISATFGLMDEADEHGRASHPGHRLRVRLADRSLRQTNPLLATLATLLELADARVTATQLLDLAGSAPVRRRFRFDDDDLDLLRNWVTRSGVRWGLDAAHRGRFSLQGVSQNTWKAGIDRILLGAAMAADEAGQPDTWLDLALPLDDVDSNDIDLAGRLAELVDRLTAVLDGLSGEHPLCTWLGHLASALDALTDVPESETWQAAQARRELGEVLTDAGERAQTVRLTLADVRALLAERLEGRPTRANFRTGNLTMCSMVPMRSVPHRVVCLLGLDDGAFPRGSGVDGDDVLARDPCVGERDPRSEDRQLLLDAVLAAREHLVVLHTGADPRTNVRRPAAVPVGEILDAVDATVRTADGRRPRDSVVVHHPLQPFDVRSFLPGRLGSTGPFSFDRHALRGAQRAAQPRTEPGPFLGTPLSPAADDEGRLDDLIGFLEHPVRGFLRQRLQVALLREEEELADGLCVHLEPLEKWAIGDRLLQARLRGADAESCRQAEWRRGALPPGSLGSRVLAELLAEVEPLVDATTGLRATPQTSVDVAVDVGGGAPLTGTVGGIHGDAVVRVVYSRLGPKHRLRAWVQLLALAAAHPGTAWTAVTVGRGPHATVQRSTLGPVGRDDARRTLAELVDLRARGLRAPLPLVVKTSATYAAKRATMTTGNALAKAAQDWTGGSFPGEQADPAHRLVWGDDAPLAVLLAEPPAADEVWADGETTRFGGLARRLWVPLLDAETTDRIDGGRA